MRYNLYFTGLMAICLLFLASCDNYLDVTPKGYTLLNTVSDYDQWLNDPVLTANYSGDLDLLGDHADNSTISVPPTASYELVYTWAPQFSSDLNTAPALWGNHYAHINKYNTVLEGIGRATGGTEQQKNSLKAEALLGRAFEYFYLLNEYTQPYDAATAAKDPGVPFVTSNDVSHAVPPRGTVQEVYDHIIADINAALPDLPTNNSNNRLRPDVGSGYSVLARTYLYARDYANAAKNAQLALQHTVATMLDYNNLPSTSDPRNLLVSGTADVLYGRRAQLISLFDTNLALVHSYDRLDLRFKWFITSDNYTARGGTNFYASRFSPIFSYANYGTTVQEMKLILAEAAARSSEVDAALQQLNEVRVKRFPAAAYQPLQSADADAVLNWVLRERTFEFPFHALRWFDMRRLDKEGRMPTVFRYDGAGNVVATLPPHSPKYTLQIPVQVLKFNPGMEQNPL